MTGWGGVGTGGVRGARLANISTADGGSRPERLHACTGVRSKVWLSPRKGRGGAMVCRRWLRHAVVCVYT